MPPRVRLLQTRIARRFTTLHQISIAVERVLQQVCVPPQFHTCMHDKSVRAFFVSNLTVFTDTENVTSMVASSLALQRLTMGKQSRVLAAQTILKRHLFRCSVRFALCYSNTH